MSIVVIRAADASPFILNGRASAKADAALSVDVYHYIENRERYFRRLADSLKSGRNVAKPMRWQTHFLI
jgi:hypothetical protein